MRYSIANQQINFYVEHNYIEFEEIIPEELILACREEFSSLINDKDPKTIYLQGRDIWRKSNSFKKIATNKNLASIVQQLCKRTKLRLAFDQISLCNLEEDKPLESLFSFQELECVVVFYLDSKENNCTFINPKHPFIPKEDCSFLYMIGYAPFKTLYVLNEQDVNTHYLKKLGYAFGDRLKEEFHPIVCWE